MNADTAREIYALFTGDTAPAKKFRYGNKSGGETYGTLERSSRAVNGNSGLAMVLTIATEDGGEPVPSLGFVVAGVGGLG